MALGCAGILDYMDKLLVEALGYADTSLKVTCSTSLFNVLVYCAPEYLIPCSQVLSTLHIEEGVNDVNLYRAATWDSYRIKETLVTYKGDFSYTA